ncbi:uncharacterized protein B0H64DRAFT_441757 [Chaetomium fimeti]|uniref:Uncharacterized protein n=1 Tax=Chaetomium fimeti TaxID=1854472 RepID=A0AAE0LRN8_9PEZI|nr:hypothetical protein B0H64DRAFT_441757 [Chaetomium fimeti]
MDKAKDALKKGLEKVTKLDEEPRQEDRKEALETTWPAREQHPAMTGGPDPHLGRAAHSGDPTGLTSKDSLGQPTNKPRP